MLTSRAGLLIVVVALPCFASSGRAQGAASLASCTTHANEMTPFDTARVSALAGAFDIVMYDTTTMRGSTRSHAGKLALWLQDSMPRRRGSTARRTQRQYLVGSYDAAPPDTGDMWRRMANRTTDAPGVFWSDGFLRLGEFGSKAGISLYVKSIGANEIHGIWTSNPGIGIVVDFTGAGEPDEAGYFCAKRIK